MLVAVLAAMNKVRMHQLSLRAHDFQLEIDNLVANGELDEGQVGDGKIPREVKRGNVTPISVVGSGAFGEVRFVCVFFGVLFVLVPSTTSITNPITELLPA